jgi:hypothetical protein
VSLLDFCIDNRLTNLLESQTDVELNSIKIERLYAAPVFKLLCRRLHDTSQQLIRACRRGKMRNLSNEKTSALHSLRTNPSIVIYKADKENTIVVMNKDKYGKKAKNIWSEPQFHLHRKKNTMQKGEEELNKYV